MLISCAVSERLRWWSAGLISACFAYWKSTYSQTLVSYLSELLPFGVGRTPDYTDLVALPVVWIVAFYVPRISLAPAATWGKFGMAVVSILALTATSFLPHYAIREAGNIPTGLRMSEETSRDLENSVDRVAMGHGLECTVCDSISEGRVYKNKKTGTSLRLLARYDQGDRKVLYEAGTDEVGRGESGPQQVDALRADLLQELRKVFPSISIAHAGMPAEHSIRLGISKLNSSASYRDPQNLGDIETAKRVIAEAAISLGLKRYDSADVYYLGGLLGWPPYSRELVVHFGIGDDPLVSVAISRHSDKYADLQQKVATEIERRLKQQFGANRAGQRCWILACYGS